MTQPNDQPIPSKFAKLYEREGKQVLVTKEETDDGEPALQFRFLSNVAEHSVALKISFKKKEGMSEWAMLDLAFDDVTEERAFSVRNSTAGVNL